MAGGAAKLSALGGYFVLPRSVGGSKCVRSSEFGGSKCIGIMGRSNGGSATVRSRGGVRSMEGPSSEVLLYMQFLISTKNMNCLGKDM